MTKKILAAALVAGLGFAHAASAQTFDDRWYVTGSAGYNFQDSNRGTQNAPFGTVGFGKFVSPSWSFDTELNYQKPVFDGRNNIVNPNTAISGEDLNWSQYGISFDMRRHFMAEGRGWNPYLLMGLGYQRSEEEYDAYPSSESPGRRKSGNLAAKVGAGIQSSLSNRVAMRGEIAYRADFDGDSVAAPDRSRFGDALASIGLVIPLGPAPMAPVAPAPAPVSQVDCSQLDSDGDGVNDCLDRCPNTPAGTVVGPDGCPVPLSIDLRGVNFDFDRSTLRPDAVAILNEAVAILQRYPQMRVEVAGHTDLCGTEQYNQALSERRARAVYDYLTANGIAVSRLSGPIGYGESRPLVNTPQTSPACRNETNRRTELNVQSQ